VQFCPASIGDCRADSRSVEVRTAGELERSVGSIYDRVRVRTSGNHEGLSACVVDLEVRGRSAGVVNLGAAAETRGWLVPTPAILITTAPAGLI
jgi:hypothetical protein